MNIIVTLVVAWVAVCTVVCGFWVWLRYEEKKHQRERLRQLANGHVADMPPWLRRREEQLNRRR